MKPDQVDSRVGCATAIREGRKKRGACIIFRPKKGKKNTVLNKKYSVFEKD